MFSQIRNFLLSFKQLNIFFTKLIHPQFLVGVILVAFNDKNEVLLVKHPWREDSRYRLPGGLVNHKDTNTSQALIREIKEELGIDLDSDKLRLLAIRKNPIPLRMDVYYLYEKILPSKFKLGTNEIKETKFFEPMDLPKSIFYGQDKIINKAFRLILAEN